MIYSRRFYYGETLRMNVGEFVTKWQKAELTEHSASQQHFLDLCNVFEHPTPAESDPTGETFTFEKAQPNMVAPGWADVCKYDVSVGLLDGGTSLTRLGTI
jgi:hypothetical protein